MITPQLEKLILCGKAFFKTFVAGGDKHTLRFGNDRFIIITDITFMPMNIMAMNGETNQNTQVAIYGERGYNHYIFRNYNIAYFANDNNNTRDFCAPTTINTYLLHEQAVGFSFCNAPRFTNMSMGIANTENPGYAPPIDFGIDGQPGVVNTILTMQTPPAATLIQENLTTRPAAGNNESQQLFFPYITENSFGLNIDNYSEYPLLLVNYVEVLGQPGNISI